MATTVNIPIDFRNPRVSSLAGNSWFSVLALTNWDAGHWEFLKDVDGKIYGVVPVPKNVNATPNAKIILQMAWNATSGVSRLSVKSKNVANAATLDASFTAETSQDITVPGTAYFREDVTFTLTNAPAADDLLLVEVFHEGAHANDSVAVNTLLFEAFLQVDI